MEENVRKIYDYVKSMEDEYYARFAIDARPLAVIQNTAHATSFQMVRYFIEDMYQDQ